MDELAALLPISQLALWQGFAVFIRIGAIMATLPAFGDQTVPVRVRLALTIAFTFIVAPSLFDQIQQVPDVGPKMALLLAPEIIAGLLFGLFLRFHIFALQIAGSIAAQSTSLSQIFGGSAGVDPQPAIGHLLVVTGTALAAMMGLHVQVAAYMIHSYNLVPFGIFVAADTIVSVGLNEVSKAFALGFQLSAPFVIASLIYNIVLGVINRAMPQLMVSFVGAPAITAGGLILLLLAAPLMLSVWITAFHGFIYAPFGEVP